LKLRILFLLVLCSVPVSAHAVEHPLTVSADGRSLLDARGDVVVFNAATPWHLAARLTREEVGDYLDARASQGINALLMALMVTEGYNTGSADNAYGEQPFHTPGDFSTPNEAYFQHVDWVIEQARLRGMTMFITPVYLGWGCGDEGWCDEVNAQGPAALRDFGRWVGQRYVDQPNIVWVNGGDVDAWQFGAGEETEALVRGVKEFDDVHLWTAHCDRENSGRDCYDQPWLDFDTTYSDCSTSPAQIRDDYQRIPWMPTVYIEGIYEFEHDVTGQCIRSQAWWAALGGLSGHFFGSGKIWDFPAWWRDGLDTEGTESMLHLGRIMNARGWGELTPDFGHMTMVAGYGSIDDDSWAATATRSDRNSILAYIPTPRTVTIDMGRVNGTGADAWWINPATGASQLIGRFVPSGLRDFTTPGPGDWVLIIDNADAALSDPWVATTAVGDTPQATPVQILSASPNPFNPRTVLSFSGPAGSRLRGTIHDARGRLVADVFDGPASGGVQTLTWEPDGLASGSYFFRVSADGETSVRKITLLK
jgi:hypothetical protein